MVVIVSGISLFGLKRVISGFSSNVR
jgi:hypothetical protein